MDADRLKPGPTGDEILFPRSSGVLFPIPCLPSTFGIGDLGPYSYRLADYLHSAGQRVWQTCARELPAAQRSYLHRPGLQALRGGGTAQRLGQFFQLSDLTENRASEIHLKVAWLGKVHVFEKTILQKFEANRPDTIKLPQLFNLTALIKITTNIIKLLDIIRLC
jgi:hypothetical protein